MKVKNKMKGKIDQLGRKHTEKLLLDCVKVSFSLFLSLHQGRYFPIVPRLRFVTGIGKKRKGI